MNRFRIITLSLFAACLLIGSATTWFLMARYQVSLPTLINKVANRLSGGDGQVLLIEPSMKYSDTSLEGIIQPKFPRILSRNLTQMVDSFGDSVFNQRIDTLYKKQLGLRIDCNSLLLSHSLNCFTSKQTQHSYQKLITSLNKFYEVKPKVSGNKSNSWQYAFAVDALKASTWLTQQQRTEFDVRVSQMLQRYLLLLDNDGASLWHSRFSLSAQAFLLATVLDRNNEHRIALYRRALGHFKQSYQAIMSTETWPGGYNYWINNRAFIAILSFSAYHNTLEEPSQRLGVMNAIKRIGRAHIHFVRPDFKIEGWADEGPRIDLKDETARVIDLIAQLTQAPEFFHFAQAIRQRFGAASYYSAYRWLLPWLYDADAHLATSGKATHQKSQLLAPLAGYLPNAALYGKEMRNHLAIRSGWQDDDTFISYQASHIFTHHQHYNAGHFTVFKGAPLLVDAGQYNGSVMSERRLHMDIRTLSKNSLLIEQPEEIVKPNYLFSENIAAGGQRLVMPTGSAITSMDHWRTQQNNNLHLNAANLIRYQQQPGLFTAISTDITPAYNSTRYTTDGNKAKVKQVIRHLAYLEQQDVLLTYDRIVTTDSSYQAKWLAHTIDKPVINGLKAMKGSENDGIFSSLTNEIKVVNGQSELHLAILAPSKPITTLVGGERYQHYVEDDGDSNVYDGRFVEQGYVRKPWYDDGKWRMEVSSLDASPISRYLVMMQPRLSQDNKAVIAQYQLRQSNGASAHFGKLLLLWPQDKSSWHFQLSQPSQQLVVFLDKAQSLVVNSKGLAPVHIDAKVGFNFVPLALKEGAQVIVSQSR